MTAATATSEETVLFAIAVLHEALALQPEPRRAVITEMETVDSAIDDYYLILCRDIDWDRFYPELAGEADPYEAAVAKAADEAGMVAGELITAMARAGVKARTRKTAATTATGGSAQ
jgi:hypothetical protein